MTKQTNTANSTKPSLGMTTPYIRAENPDGSYGKKALITRNVIGMRRVGWAFVRCGRGLIFASGRISVGMPGRLGRIAGGRLGDFYFLCVEGRETRNWLGLDVGGCGCWSEKGGWEGCGHGWNRRGVDGCMAFRGSG